MRDNQKGCIYILTNPSFPDYVKIGYADDIDTRLRQLNRTECTPFAFRVYATYEVDTRLTDMKIHNMIDKLNPNLRSIDNINGKKRIREFFAITAEAAYEIFEAMAEIHGTTDKLKLIQPTAKEEQDEKVAICSIGIVKKKKRRNRFGYAVLRYNYLVLKSFNYLSSFSVILFRTLQSKPFSEFIG